MYTCDLGLIPRPLFPLFTWPEYETDSPAHITASLFQICPTASDRKLSRAGNETQHCWLRFIASLYVWDSDTNLFSGVRVLVKPSLIPSLPPNFSSLAVWKAGWGLGTKP